MKTLVGIDMGMCSPAMAIVNFETCRIDCFAWAQRKRENSFGKQSWKLDIRNLPAPWSSLKTFTLHLQSSAPKKPDRIAKMHNVVFTLLAHLQNYTKPGKHTWLAIENYAYGMQSSSTTKLAELGGILRHELWTHEFGFKEPAPNRIKAKFANHGHASKVDMWNRFRELGFPDLLHHLGLQPKKDGIPHPVEDVVDAVAIAYATWADRQPGASQPKKRKKRKRKQKEDPKEKPKKRQRKTK